jgi:hypothetical protein
MIMEFWLGACIVAGGWQIGTWAVHALQWLYNRLWTRSWSAEDILRREG